MAPRRAAAPGAAQGATGQWHSSRRSGPSPRALPTSLGIYRNLYLQFIKTLNKPGGKAPQNPFIALLAMPGRERRAVSKSVP